MKTIIRNFVSVLRRFKMATLLNVLGLSIAFAAFMLIFMQLDYDWNYNKKIKNSDRIFRFEVVHENGSVQSIISRPMAETLFNSSPYIQGGAIVQDWRVMSTFVVEHNGEKNFFVERIIKTSSGVLDVFDFTMVEGVAEALKEPRMALIPLSLSKKIFGNESAVGKKLDNAEFSDQSLIIGGVYKDFPDNSSVYNVVYFPMEEDENKTSWGNQNYSVYVRLDSPDMRQDVIENFKKTFDTSGFKDGYEWIKLMNYRLTSLEEIHFVTNVSYDTIPKASRSTLYILFAIAFIIVIIAGINFTNFSTALTPMRIKGINTHKILGAEQQILRLSLLMEAVSISLVSYLLSLGIVYLLSQNSIAFIMDGSVQLSSYPILVLVVGIIAFLTGLLAGLYPSYYTTSFAPALVLKGSFGLSPKGRKLRNVLISIQFISSFALIIGALFMFLQNHYMKNAPLGYDKDQLIVTEITNKLLDGRKTLENQLKSFSGIQDVTFASMLLSSSDTYMGWGKKYNDKSINFQCLPVDPSFLKVMGIQITEGRDFRGEDELKKEGTYIFNQTARDRFELALGKGIDDSEIIGFTSDVKFASFRQEVAPMAFFVWGTENWGMRPRIMYVKVNAGANMFEAIQHVRSSLKTLDSSYAFEPRFYDDVLNNLYEKERKTSALITLFSLIAIFISIVGVFGLVVFESEYRRKEIGVRKVLGSSTGEILIMFNKIYIRILCVCYILSAPIAYYAISRWLENFAYKTPLYWWVFAVAFFVVALITVITVTFQNWKAASDNPVKSIKSE